MNLTLHYSERVYNALLSLYPVRFRIRFAPEMLQLFRDCCHDALEKGEVAVLAAFWLRAMRDLFFSAVRERQREVLGPLNSEHPLMGIIDLTLIPTIVTVNLIALGPILTLLVRGGLPGFSGAVRDDVRFLLHCYRDAGGRRFRRDHEVASACTALGEIVVILPVARSQK